MVKTKQIVRCITTTFAIGIASTGLATLAHADAMYETDAYLRLTLTSVTGGDESSEWYVDYENYLIGSIDETGDGVATYSSTADNSGSLCIGESIAFATGAYGSSGVGSAESDALMFVDLFVENYSDSELTFTFDYEYSLSATVGSTTNLDSDNAAILPGLNGIDVLDNFFSINIYEIISAAIPGGPYVAFLADSGSFSFSLFSGEYNEISAELYSSGYSASSTPAPVPEPATLLLLGTGLVGLTASRFRKQDKS